MEQGLVKQMQEILAMRSAIEAKLAANEALTIQEIWFMGDHLELDILPNYPQCLDMYYRKLFILFRDGILDEPHLFNFQMLVTNWLDHLNADYEPGSLGFASQKETLREVNSLEKKWNDNPQTNNDERDEDLFELLAWSKFRYILVRKIFDLQIKAPYYSLYLAGKEIRFDFETVMHILTRHFAHGMKPYLSPKDHFYGVFRHDELHKDFAHIFHAIEKSGLYHNDDVSDLNFRYKGIVYKMYSPPLHCIANSFRISTFFPVSSKKIFDKLDAFYKEEKVNNELSVFVKEN